MHTACQWLLPLQLEIKSQVFILLYKVPHALIPACLFSVIISHSLTHSLCPSHAGLKQMKYAPASGPLHLPFFTLQTFAWFTSSLRSAFIYSKGPKIALSNPLSHVMFPHSTFGFHIIWYIDLLFYCMPPYPPTVSSTKAMLLCRCQLQLYPQCLGKCLVYKKCSINY